MRSPGGASACPSAEQPVERELRVNVHDVIRYGGRSQVVGRRGRDQEVESEDAAQLLPLLDPHDDETPPCTRRRKTRAFRVASRCQVT